MDKERFVSEIEAHSGMLYRVAWSILRNDDDCKDALQDAAMKAYSDYNEDERRGAVDMKWFLKVFVFPIWLIVILLRMIARLLSNLSAFFIGLAMLLGIALGLYAAIQHRWTDAALFIICEGLLILFQIAAASVEMILESASDGLGKIVLR